MSEDKGDRKMAYKTQKEQTALRRSMELYDPYSSAVLKLKLVGVSAGTEAGIRKEFLAFWERVKGKVELEATCGVVQDNPDHGAEA
ncbi:MAG: hypothetical protein K2P45_09100 [Eubacterium sp.]|nr:hypothetical protein [Eubacterium sp.]